MRCHDFFSQKNGMHYAKTSSGIYGQQMPCANRIIGYYRMYEWKENAQVILCTCIGRWESAHSAHVQRHFFLLNEGQKKRKESVRMSSASILTDPL